MTFEHDEPCYIISVVSRIVGLHAQTLRYYERAGLLEPSRSGGNIRLYSARDVERLRRIKSLTDDLGVNLAGVEVIIKLLSQVSAMEEEMKRLQARIAELAEGQNAEGQYAASEDAAQ